MLAGDARTAYRSRVAGGAAAALRRLVAPAE
jgi:hypothetical protein